MNKKILSTSTVDKPVVKSLKLQAESMPSGVTVPGTANPTKNITTGRKSSTGGGNSFNIDNLLQVPNLSQADKSKSYVESLQRAGLMWPAVLNTPASISQPMGFIIPQQQNHLLSLPHRVADVAGSMGSQNEEKPSVTSTQESDEDKHKDDVEVV